MAILYCEGHIINWLEEKLYQFDKIFLIDSESFLLQSFLRELENQISKSEKVLTLFVYKEELCEISKFTYCQITEEQQNQLLNIYNMYEFSGAFYYVTKKNRYGTIWNYVDTGILTMQEAIRSLLV